MITKFEKVLNKTEKILNFQKTSQLKKLWYSVYEPRPNDVAWGARTIDNE